jgi:L-malate glycosyltransferase
MNEPGKGSESGYFTFVHLSNFRPQHKNTIGIVRAFAQAVMSEPNIKLILAGSGSREDEDEIKHTVAQLGISDDNFQFLAQLPHKEALDLMGKADALICFSNFETFNITCAESVCMGTPVIYTACGGPEEYLDEDMGVEVPKQNKLQLSKLMISMARKELVFDRNLVAQKGRTLFNSEQWAAFTKSFYQKSGLLL